MFLAVLRLVWRGHDPYESLSAQVGTETELYKQLISRDNFSALQTGTHPKNKPIISQCFYYENRQNTL